MKNEHIFREFQAPSGKRIRVGERYTNAQGIEMEVAKISKPADDADVLVEFRPVDKLLANTLWWGVFLTDCLDIGGLPQAR